MVHFVGIMTLQFWFLHEMYEYRQIWNFDRVYELIPVEFKALTCLRISEWGHTSYNIVEFRGVGQLPVVNCSKNLLKGSLKNCSQN